MYYTMMYTGSLKINAIKAVREVFGLGLKDSKEIVDGDAVRVSAVQKLAVLGCYLTSMEDYPDRNGNSKDWTFAPIMPPLALVDLTTHKPIERTVEDIEALEAQQQWYRNRRSW